MCVAVAQYPTLAGRNDVGDDDEICDSTKIYVEYGSIRSKHACVTEVFQAVTLGPIFVPPRVVGRGDEGVNVRSLGSCASESPHFS